MPVLSSWFIVLFKSSVYFLTLCYSTIIESGVLKSPNITVELSISSFNYVSFVFFLVFWGFVGK